MRVEGMTVKCSQHVQKLGKVQRIESFPAYQGHHVSGRAFINNHTFDGILGIVHVDLLICMVR
jgi:hypothetical protein